MLAGEPPDRFRLAFGTCGATSESNSRCRSPLDVGEALREEGLKVAALTQILTDLDAPELDPVERLLVPFARETIWYEPALVQQPVP